MRGMFKLDDAKATAIEEALLAHGGGGALNMGRNEEEAEVQRAMSRAPAHVDPGDA